MAEMPVAKITVEVAATGDHEPTPNQKRCQEMCGDRNFGYHVTECPILQQAAGAPQIPPPPIPADREGRREWNDAFVRARGAIPCWTTFEDGFHGVDPAPDGKGTWVSAEDFCTVVARAEAALAAERQPVLTKEEIVAASDGDHIEVSEAERGNFMTANGKLWILESVAAKAVMRGEERLMDAEATLTAERQRIKLALEAANELPLSGIWQKRARIIELLSEVKK